MTHRLCLWARMRKKALQALSADTKNARLMYYIQILRLIKSQTKTLLYYQMARYWVERAFLKIKEQLGMHQYQVRSWKAWYHHIVFSMMALDFIHYLVLM